MQRWRYGEKEEQEVLASIQNEDVNALVQYIFCYAAEAAGLSEEQFNEVRYLANRLDAKLKEQQ